jgi:transposase
MTNPEEEAAGMKNREKTQQSKRRSRRKEGGRVVEVRASAELRRINEHAAGIDIGAERYYVAVPPGSTEHPVREFGVFTKDLYAAAEWLRECGVETVAMESTGVYWVPLYEVLEDVHPRGAPPGMKNIES